MRCDMWYYVTQLQAGTFSVGNKFSFGFQRFLQPMVSVLRSDQIPSTILEFHNCFLVNTGPVLFAKVSLNTTGSPPRLYECSHMNASGGVDCLVAMNTLVAWISFFAIILQNGSSGLRIRGFASQTHIKVLQEIHLTVGKTGFIWTGKVLLHLFSELIRELVSFHEKVQLLWIDFYIASRFCFNFYREPSDAHMNSMLERLFLETNGSVRVSKLKNFRSFFTFVIHNLLSEWTVKFVVLSHFLLMLFIIFSLNEQLNL